MSVNLQEEGSWNRDKVAVRRAQSYPVRDSVSSKELLCSKMVANHVTVSARFETVMPVPEKNGPHQPTEDEGFIIVRPEGTSNRSRGFRKTISGKHAASLKPRNGPFMPYTKSDQLGGQKQKQAPGTSNKKMGRNKCTSHVSSKVKEPHGKSAPPVKLTNWSQRPKSHPVFYERARERSEENHGQVNNTKNRRRNSFNRNHGKKVRMDDYQSKKKMEQLFPEEELKKLIDTHLEAIDHEVLYRIEERGAREPVSKFTPRWRMSTSEAAKEENAIRANIRDALSVALSESNERRTARQAPGRYHQAYCNHAAARQRLRRGIERTLTLFSPDVPPTIDPISGADDPPQEHTPTSDATVEPVEQETPLQTVVTPDEETNIYMLQTAVEETQDPLQFSTAHELYEFEEELENLQGSSNETVGEPTTAVKRVAALFKTTGEAIDRILNRTPSPFRSKRAPSPLRSKQSMQAATRSRSESKRRSASSGGDDDGNSSNNSSSEDTPPPPLNLERSFLKNKDDPNVSTNKKSVHGQHKHDIDKHERTVEEPTHDTQAHNIAQNANNNRKSVSFQQSPLQDNITENSFQVLNEGSDESEMSASDSDSESSIDTTSSGSINSRHQRRRCHKGCKKRKGRSTSKILSELMKNAKHCEIKPMQLHAQIDRRLREFISYSEYIQRITMLTPEIARTFRDLGKIRRPRTTEANKALYHLILAKVDNQIAVALQAYMKEKGCEDGRAAFYYVRSICAPQDAESRHQASTKFYQTRIIDNESLQRFNARFNNLTKIVQASGTHIDQKEVIGQYLRAIQVINNQILQVKIQLYRLQIMQGVQVSLTTIQSGLQREEENTNAANDSNQNLRLNMRSDQRRSSQSNNASSNNSNTAAQSNTRNNQKGNYNGRRPNNTTSIAKRDTSNIKCYGCGQTGHYLRNCPTTSPQDRAKTYEKMQPRQETNESAANQTSVTSPTSQRTTQAHTAHASAKHMSFINNAHAKDQARTTSRSQGRTFDTHEPRFVVYEEEVIIDSGASDHMTGLGCLLFDPYEFMSEVHLPDGSISYSRTAGTMRVECRCLVTGMQYIIPLFDTLHVPGFTKSLWSVPMFAASGHEVVFGLSTIRIVMNRDTPEEFEIHLRHPYYRNPQNQIFANMVHTTQTPQGILKRRVDLELLHRRLGHASSKSLLAAEEAGLYADTKIEFAPTGPCIDCKIGAIRASNKGHVPVGPTIKPGDIWFLDLVDNPSKVGLTKSSYFPHYVNIIDSASRYQVFVGIRDMSSASVIQAVELLSSVYRPHDDFTINDISEIHVDAGSQLISEEFKEWGRNRPSPIVIIAAAPNHQEQNGKAESGWRHIKTIVFKILTHASLGHEFFDMALTYAWQIKAVLPLRGLNVELSDKTTRPATPFEIYFKRKARVGRYKVFGCPCVMKVYVRNQDKQGVANSNSLTSKTIIQRGIRGIFVGFPIDQAGYLIWIPSSGHFLVSADVAFDEEFTSPMAYPRRLFHDAKPTRDAVARRMDTSIPLSHTGPPYVVLDTADPTLPWAPYTNNPPTHPVNNIQDFDTDDFPHVDVSSVEEENCEAHETSEHSSIQEEQLEPFADSDKHRKATVQAINNKYYSNETGDQNSRDQFSSNNDEEYYRLDDTNVDIDEDVDIEDTDIFNDDNLSPEDNNENEDVMDISSTPSQDSVIIEQSQQERPYDHGNIMRRSSRLRKTTQRSDFKYSNSAHAVRQVAYALSVISQTVTKPNDHMPLARDFAEAIGPMPGEAGSDPSFFIPEPRSLRQVIKMPLRYRTPWIEAFVKEFKGLHRLHTYKAGQPGPNDPVTPVMDIYKCKLDQNGMIDKLKCRMVFRGDLYDPVLPEDSWNPFASHLALRFFLALCAKYKIFPAQADWVQAYLQCDMKEKVYIMFPAFWAEYLPEELAKFCGIPLELLKALYGYTYSGKRLYEAQEDFLKEQGFEQSPLLGLWYKRLSNDGIFLILVFADDALYACTDSKLLHDFQQALMTRFEVEWRPRADWYLQARIQQDKNGNITLDQSRYSKAIVQRYLPNADQTPTVSDLRTYRYPLPRNFKWTREDNASSGEESKQLESEYGYRFIEAVGSLNFLSNTAIRQLFAIRKTCKHMHMPGRNHYKALHHILHHLRCYPAKALIYYHDVSTSPLASLLKEAGHGDLDPTFVYFTDSAFGDCDDARSTGCYLGLFQGGLIDFSSSVPLLIAHSAAEAETTYASVTCVATALTRRAYMAIVCGDEDRAFSVPILTDSKATIDIARNDRGTARTKHMARRELYVRQCFRLGSIRLLHVAGDQFQLSDIGTKGDIVPADFEYKLSVIEAPSSVEATTVSLQAHSSRRGVLSPSPTDDVTVAGPILSSQGFRGIPKGSAGVGTTPNYSDKIEDVS